MGKRWPKVIRDPVHNIIPFEDTACDKLLLDLINTREVQRLRRIKQLGMSELVFPGANHSRFSHCIGVMHIARKMLDRVDRLTANKTREDQRTAVLAAALLHDVGHGPFSHAFEKVSGEDHESRTLEIILDPATEVSRRLRKHDKKLPDRLAVFFDEDIDAKKRQKADLPDFLTQIVSSQLDADRFDYLLRDSHASGADYGKYDLDWLLAQLLLDGSHNRFYLARKALDAAEAYVFARYHMYRAVYFHKTVRAAEVMLRLTLRRFKELLEKSSSSKGRGQVVPGASSKVVAAFSSQKLSLEDYLSLDDLTLTEFFKATAGATDPLLASLGSGLINRRLYKAMDMTDSDGASVAKFFDAARVAVRKKGLDPEYAIVDDTAADTPYKPYDPDDAKPASQIYIESADGGNVELGTRSDAVEQLRKRYSLLRYYFPQDVRDGVETIADGIFKKERKK